jgi:hypothetical protein
MKRALVIILCTIGVLMMLIFEADAETTSDGFLYEIAADNTVTILKYSNVSALQITIPSLIDGKSVTSIGEMAFNACSSLTTVSIPDSVTSIGSQAFWPCISLTTISIPDSVTNIGWAAFSGCVNLTTISIPDSITNIGQSVFSGCTSLRNITIPNSVTSISESAFDGCSSLASITIPDSVTSIGDCAFRECTCLTNIIIPDSVTNIGVWAFYSCNSLTSISIPNSVTSIGDSTFEKCGSLISITIPDSVTSIGAGAFRECSSLTSIILPDSVTSIGADAFSNCSSLVSFKFPDRVRSIGDSAFLNCNKLTCISIPDSVTSIGIGAFQSCDNMLSITIPEDIQMFAQILKDCNLVCIWGAEGGNWQNYAQRYDIDFLPIRSSIEAICLDYVHGKSSVGMFFTQLNQWEDIAEDYTHVEVILRQNEKMDEYNQFCSLLSAFKDMKDKKPELFAYLEDYEIGNRSDKELTIAFILQKAGMNEALMSKIYQPQQNTRFVPVLWTDEALKKYFGKISVFVPQKPQKGTCLLIADSNSKIELYGKIENVSELIIGASLYQAGLALPALVDGSGGKLKITGDPNDASIWLYFCVTYPFAGTYTTGSNISVKVYNCEMTLTAFDIVKRKEIAKVTFGKYYGSSFTTNRLQTPYYAVYPSIDGNSGEMQAFLAKILVQMNNWETGAISNENGVNPEGDDTQQNADGDTPSLYRTLTIGSTGPDVAKLKQRMYELGYFRTNTVNELFTATTAEYVKEFEIASGLLADGIADPEMLALFYSDKAIPKP